MSVTVERRWTLLVAAVAVALAGLVLSPVLRDDDEPTAGLEVTWGGSEGHPSCLYDPVEQTVDARLKVTGNARDHQEVTATVTAYADENTSEPVGSATRTVQLDGVAGRSFVVTIHVDRPPHVGEDDETACRLSVDF